MLLGGGSSCQACGCVSCICTATCTEPHTGDAFEAVYTRFFEGAEAGNTTDGYLTATGDSDTSDPYDGMDGSGPWYQRVSGGFTLGGPSSGTRFPCEVRVSFWRNNYTLGASTIPPASTALTENVVEVIVSSGALVAPDGTVITPEDGAVAIASVPLVAGGGDQSAADPRSGDGTVSYRSQCWSVETIFTIRATIRWNTQKRQHVLYGIVRECYEEGDPCGPGCESGDSGTPDVMYLTISNLSLYDAYYNYDGSGNTPGAADTYYVPSISADWNSILSGAIVLERVPWICDQWKACFPWSGGLCSPCITYSTQYGLFISSAVNYGLFGVGVLTGCNEYVTFYLSLGPVIPCKAGGSSGSGTTTGSISSGYSGYGGISFSASFDWEITA